MRKLLDDMRAAAAEADDAYPAGDMASADRGPKKDWREKRTLLILMPHLQKNRSAAPQLATALPPSVRDFPVRAPRPHRGRG